VKVRFRKFTGRKFMLLKFKQVKVRLGENQACRKVRLVKVRVGGKSGVGKVRLVRLQALQLSATINSLTFFIIPHFSTLIILKIPRVRLIIFPLYVHRPSTRMTT
jgi:hypothetical protein